MSVRLHFCLYQQRINRWFLGSIVFDSVIVIDDSTVWWCKWSIGWQWCHLNCWCCHVLFSISIDNIVSFACFIFSVLGTLLHHLFCSLLGLYFICISWVSWSSKLLLTSWQFSQCSRWRFVIELHHLLWDLNLPKSIFIPLMLVSPSSELHWLLGSCHGVSWCWSILLWFFASVSDWCDCWDRKIFEHV